MVGWTEFFLGLVAILSSTVALITTGLMYKQTKNIQKTNETNLVISITETFHRDKRIHQIIQLIKDEKPILHENKGPVNETDLIIALGEISNILRFLDKGMLDLEDVYRGS